MDMEKSFFAKIIISWGLQRKKENWGGYIEIDRGDILKICPYPRAKIISFFSWKSRTNNVSDGIVVDVDAPKNAEIKVTTRSLKFKFKIAELWIKDRIEFGHGNVRVSRVKEGEGKAFICPGVVTAGSVSGIKLTYIAGPAGIAVGGGIRILTPGRTDCCLGEPVISTTGKGKVIISEDWIEGENSLSHGQVELGCLSVEAKALTIKIEKAPLLYKNRIMIKFSKVHWQTFSDKGYPFVILVDGCGNGVYSRIDKNVYLNIKASRPAGLKVSIPSLATRNRQFPIAVDILDKYGNLAPGYHGKIGLSIIDKNNQTFSKMICFFHGEAEKGLSTKIKINGSFRIVGKEINKSWKTVSYPIRVAEYKPNDNLLYWGDLHIHSTFSDGYGTPEFIYHYARQVAKLDFSAITDHSPFLTLSNWQETQAACQRFNCEGKFVTLLGYESNYCISHLKKKNEYGGNLLVYFPGKRGMLLRGESIKYKGEKKSDRLYVIDKTSNKATFLWKKLKREGVITIPHHLYFVDSLRPHDRLWPRDEMMMPSVEIYSNWGSGESGLDRKPSYTCRGLIRKGGIGRSGCFQNLLALGGELGVVAGSDDHHGRAGGRHYIEDAGGLTAVYAPRLIREDIFKGIKYRHSYATTGVKIILEFFINGRIMGEVIYLKKRKMIRKIEVKVCGTNKIEKVEIIKNNKIFYIHRGKSWNEDFSYIDNSLIHKRDYYYIRVTQVDGEMAWSSPIFVYGDK